MALALAVPFGFSDSEMSAEQTNAMRTIAEKLAKKVHEEWDMLDVLEYCIGNKQPHECPSLNHIPKPDELSAQEKVDKIAALIRQARQDAHGGHDVLVEALKRALYWINRKAAKRW
jgi:hypothetical protein